MPERFRVVWPAKPTFTAPCFRCCQRFPSAKLFADTDGPSLQYYCATCVDQIENTPDPGDWDNPDLRG